jgi:hypothetical protein
MSSIAALFATRRNAFVVAALILAGLATIAVYNRPVFPGGTARNGPSQSLAGALGQTLKGAANSVASLFELRSPGARAEGLLANSKHRTGQIIRHERALPKIRKSPISPLAALVTAPPAPVVVPPVATPLFTAVANAPPAAITPGQNGVGSPGGFFGFPTPGGGGGGGGVIIPPVVITTPPGNPGTPSTPTPPTTPTTPTTPSIPTTPAVPEPASWAMMLLGFLLIGQAMRHRSPLAIALPAR